MLRALNEAMRSGTSFGAPTAREIELARRITGALPAVEQVRLVSSGTEATMTALRLARAFTGRAKFVKFDGCYHGHADALLVRAGSGAMTLGVPDSAGVPEATASQTLVARFNDLDEIERRFRADGDAIAALIVEPVVGNMGLAAAGWLPRGVAPHHHGARRAIDLRRSHDRLPPRLGRRAEPDGPSGPTSPASAK